MNTSYIGLGSNLSGSMSDPQHQLNRAVETISQNAHIHQFKLSSFYSTSPIGPKDQPDYVNAVARLKTTLQPLQLLDFLQEIEDQHQRKREQRWGARTLDLDILTYADFEIISQRLIIPHPRMEERAFVLVPLLELDGNFFSSQGKSTADLLANCADQGIVKL
ncbi:MAG: 2-amino-4-hydroxy-6-hydroxymethyldihydropteridine diphosphokinase [Polaribacter sp.]|jgi:2-amino-4-hydroxy-6-hydroxymethyldihydropteridine diphosphokinase|tara:strand:- start:2925 stop:3413 length:489 start_codon:yes stop_codon:yes gene_type:complete